MGILVTGVSKGRGLEVPVTRGDHLQKASILGYWEAI